MAEQRQGTFRLENSYLDLARDHHLYHFDLSTTDHLVKRFHDLKYVCMGGKGSRMRLFAEKIYEKLGKPDNCEFEEANENTKCKRLKDISESGGRFSLFKVGPVLSASHGMGSGSISIALHELLKLIHFAKCDGVIFIRIGTSGGLGLEPGTVILTEKAYNGLLEPYFRQVACGKEIKYDTATTSDLREALLKCAEDMKIKAIVGNTMSTNDFYEEQARLDGALCSFSSKEKEEFLNKAHDKHGIKNVEMEADCFVATCNRAKVKCAVICASIINRLKGDEITHEPSLLQSWEKYPQDVVAEFIKRSCKML